MSADATGAAKLSSDVDGIGFCNSQTRDAIILIRSVADRMASADLREVEIEQVIASYRLTVRAKR